MTNYIPIEWTTEHSVTISKEEIQEMIARCHKEHNYSEPFIEHLIDDWVSGLDDADYCAWTEDATKQVFDAVIKEMGGVQLSMFD